jgi:hypothetical protein
LFDLPNSDHKNNKIFLNSNKFALATITFYDIFRKNIILRNSQSSSQPQLSPVGMKVIAVNKT